MKMTWLELVDLVIEFMKAHEANVVLSSVKEFKG